MNYIYDILLNYNENIYEFYDWNKSDSINHIKKIPIFKINKNKFRQILENEVIFEKSFLEKIKNKTEEFSFKGIKPIKYAFVLSDGIQVLALNICSKIKYSKLLIDEETDVINKNIPYKEEEINFIIKKPKKIEKFKTRKEIEEINNTKKIIKDLLNENNCEKIKYLYFECFNKKKDSIPEIIKELNEKIDNKYIISKINDFINIKNV